MSYKIDTMARLKEEDLRLNIIINGDSARKKLGDLKEAMSETKATVAALEKERKKLVKTYGEESTQVKALDAKLVEQRKNLKSLRDQYADAQRKMDLTKMSMKELQSHARSLSAQLRNTNPGTKQWQQLNAELLKTNTRLRELRTQSAATSKAMGAVNAIRTVYMGAAAAVFGLARVFGGAINTIKDFEQANANLATILGTNIDGIAQLTKEAERLGRTTEYTASEVTGLQTELAKLGFSQSQIMAMEEPVLHFATAVGTTLPEAAALAGSALRMFGLRASDTDDTLGAMAVATNKSALNFGYIQNALSTVGPVARTFGISLKDTIALLGALANAGFDASSAATATRNILLNMADSSGDLAKALGKPVKTFPEMIAGLQALNEKGLSLAETLDMTDKRSVSAFNQFLRGAGDAQELREALENVDGELERIASERMNTLEGATKRLKSAWEGFILSMKGSSGFLKQITEDLAGMIQMLTPGSRHNNNVDVVVQQIKDGEKTTEMIAEHIEINQKKIESLQQQLDEAHSRREKRRLEKLIKEGEERNSVLKEALSRMATTEGEDEVVTTGGTGGSGGGGSDSKKTWSLQNDESFLKAKAALTKRFNEGEIKTQEEYNEQLYQLEVAALSARIAARKESGADLQKIESDLQDKIMSHRLAEQKLEEQAAKIISEARAAALTGAQKQMEEENRRYEEEKKKYQGQKDVLAAIEVRHQATMRRIAVSAENESMQDLQKRHNLEKQQLENQWAERIALAKKGSAEEMDLQKAAAEAIAKFDLPYLEALSKQLQEITTTGIIGESSLTDEEVLAFKQKLSEVVKKINEAKASLKKEDTGALSGTGDGSLFGVSQEQWQLLFSNLEHGKLSAESLNAALQGLGGAAQEGFKLAERAINLTNAKEQAALKEYIKVNDQKKSDLEKRLSAGLMTQAQYESEVKKLDEEREAREEEMAINQAERQKKLSLVQAIINTALGVTQTLAQWGIPWGIAPAAIMAAMGAAEVAMIAATPVTGREKGGPFVDDDGTVVVKRKQDGKRFPARLDPKKRGFVNRPTVLVGENGSEYVIPHEAMENPSIRPFINSIETARQNGQLKNLRLEAVRPEVTMIGRASGGFAYGEPEAAGVPSGTMPRDYTEMLELLRKMNAIFSKPIRADVSMLGRHGLLEAQDDYERIKKNGQL